MEKKYIEKGRIVSFKDKGRSGIVGVILDIQSQINFVVQLVCVESGKLGERVISTTKEVALLDDVVEYDDSEEVRGKKFSESLEKSLRERGVVEKFKGSAEYQSLLKERAFAQMNDFERFMVEERERLRENLLKSKGF